MTLLERVLANNARFPVDEAAKFRAHTESDALLAEYATVESPPDELTYAVIRLLRYLKRHRAALELMQRRRPHIPAKAREIDFYEMELHYHGGERAQGDLLLETLQAGGARLRPSWTRAIEKIRRNLALEDTWAELARVEGRIADLAIDIDLGVHLPLLQAVMPEPNRALEVLLFVRQRMAVLRGLSPATVPREPSLPGYHVATLLFACGFGWSGSGAVAGFLSQRRQVTLPFGSSELGYLQGRFGREGFLAFLRPGAIAFGAMQKMLARFFIESVVALRDVRHHYSVLAQCMGARRGHARTLGCLLDDFHAAMLAPDALADVTVRKRLLGAFLQRLLSVQGGSHVLLNNVLLASNLVLAEFMENARFIVVERDARDQYVARQVECAPADRLEVDAFVQALRAGRESFLANRDALGAAGDGRLRLVRFETFLGDGAVRAELLDWLGLDQAGIAPDSTKFDASVSSLNIGIHAGKLAPTDEERIASGVGLYMH